MPDLRAICCCGRKVSAEGYRPKADERLPSPEVSRRAFLDECFGKARTQAASSCSLNDHALRAHKKGPTSKGRRGAGFPTTVHVARHFRIDHPMMTTS